MKRYGFLLVLFVCLPLATTSCDQEETRTQQASVVTPAPGPYLGQEPPEKTAELFAPGIISTENNEALYGFFNNGTLLLFDRTPAELKDWSPDVHRMELKDGKWLGPDSLQLQGKPWYKFYTTAPVGERIYFAWRGSPDEMDSSADLNIWQVQMTGDGWAEPRKLPAPVNTGGMDTFPSATRDGTLYFFSDRPGGFGSQDLYRAPLINGSYPTVENLGAPINTEFDDLDPFIAPDESYLIFASDITGGFGGFDLYIVFKDTDGIWTEPVNMGEGINTSDFDWIPYVTEDEKCFFFNRTHSGIWDIYWVDASVIEELKPDSIKKLK